MHFLHHPCHHTNETLADRIAEDEQAADHVGDACARHTIGQLMFDDRTIVNFDYVG